MNIQPIAAPAAARGDERITDVAPAATVAPRDSANASKAEPTRDELDAAVKHINESLTTSAQGLEFSVDKDSKETVVKVVDRDTQEVLRQMPSREALEIAKSIDKAMGRLISQRA